MDAVIIFTRVTSASTGASNNNKTLANGVILKSFIGFFRNLESLAVRRSSQVSRRHTIYELLGCGNQAGVETERGSPGSHGGVEFEGHKATKKWTRKWTRKLVGTALTMWNPLR